MCAPVVAVAAQDQLWGRAITVYQENSDWHPRLITVTSKEYDGQGKLRHEELTVTRQFLTEEGELESELVSVIRDGKDITEERRKNPNAGRSFGPPTGSEDQAESSPDAFVPVYRSVFSPQQQEHVEYARTDRSRTINGRRARAFTFVHEPNDDARAEGTVWIDEETAEPLLLESSLDPGMIFVQEFQYSHRYASEGDEWRLRTMRFDVGAGLLMFRRDFDITMEFDEYFYAPGVEVGPE
ncbi:MAG: hypothetical protein GVY29_10910 [Spirochaetes bacterium]|nr:hypothetical protein [Spirochaetota bacterium]